MLKYHQLAKAAWRAAAGTWYRWGGRVIDNGGSNTVQVLRNGRVVLSATDDGSVGGPRLTGGRVGVRSDHADVDFDNLRVSTP